MAKDSVDMQFNPWPRPIHSEVVGLIEKLCALVLVIIGLSQVLPQFILDLLFGGMFTIILLITWIVPVGAGIFVRAVERITSNENGTTSD